MASVGEKRGVLRIVLAAAVVIAGLAAIVWALIVTLDHYPVQEAGKGAETDDRSASVVAVMAPVVAGVGAVVGLYFGISGTGSPKGQEMEKEVLQEAKAVVEEAKKPD